MGEKTYVDDNLCTITPEGCACTDAVCIDSVVQAYVTDNPCVHAFQSFSPALFSFCPPGGLQCIPEPETDPDPLPPPSPWACIQMTQLEQYVDGCDPCFPDPAHVEPEFILAWGRLSPEHEARYYYLLDDQHSTVGLTDEDGVLVEGYRYSPYGVPTIYNAGANGVVDWGFDDIVLQGGTSPLENRIMYTGRSWDEDTGLYYYRTRYMDPELGRFISSDTIGVWGDEANLGNGYAYVSNAPHVSTDPTGKCKAWKKSCRARMKHRMWDELESRGVDSFEMQLNVGLAVGVSGSLRFSRDNPVSGKVGFGVMVLPSFEAETNTRECVKGFGPDNVEWSIDISAIGVSGNLDDLHGGGAYDQDFSIGPLELTEGSFKDGAQYEPRTDLEGKTPKADFLLNWCYG